MINKELRYSTISNSIIYFLINNILVNFPTISLIFPKQAKTNLFSLIVSNFIFFYKIKLKSRKEVLYMNHLAKYLTMKIIPREYENDLDQIELAIYGMEGLLCNLSTLFVAIILSFIFHTTYEFVLFIFFFIPLRLSYKSFHCSSFLQCLVFSNMIILFASYFIKYVTNIPFLRLICLSLIVANYTLSFEKNKRLHCIEILILYLCSFIDSSLLVIYLISLFINTILILLKRGENHV